MTLTQTFRSTSKRHPCQVCSSSTGCLIASEDGMVAVICANAESRKKCGKLGWLHLLVDTGPVWSSIRQRIFKAARQLGEDAGTYPLAGG